MKKIAEISEDIGEELQGAEHYAKCATKYKYDDKPLAEMYYGLALTELSHVDTLHAQVARIIKESRAAGDVPPQGMMEVYDFIHGKQIDTASRVRALLDAYKK